MGTHWQWLVIALALGLSLWRLTRPLRQRPGAQCGSEHAKASPPATCGGCTGCEIGRRGAGSTAK